MNPMSEDVKDILCDSSGGVATYATDLFISEMPDSPDLCICLYDQPSWKSPEVNFDQEYPALQVITRGAVGGYLTAYAKAQEVHAVLHVKKNITRNSAFYLGIYAVTDVMPIGKDEKGRPVFSANYHAVRKPV